MFSFRTPRLMGLFQTRSTLTRLRFQQTSPLIIVITTKSKFTVLIAKLMSTMLYILIICQLTTTVLQKMEVALFSTHMQLIIITRLLMELIFLLMLVVAEYLEFSVILLVITMLLLIQAILSHPELKNMEFFFYALLSNLRTKMLSTVQ